MKSIAGFFQEPDGQWSSQRLIFIIGSIYAMVMGAVVFGKTGDSIQFMVVVTTLNATFGAQKLMQKSMENKPLNTDKSA